MTQIVVSASRRTDLPRFHYRWLQQALDDGEATIANPRFPEKVYRVDLRPANVHSLVLWSKDFSNVLTDPGHLINYNLYFQYTINNYSVLLEPQVPAYRQSIMILDKLLSRYRPEQFNIRFDPVIISTGGEISPDKDRPGKARLEAFGNLCQDLVALGMNNCRITTSYLTMYPHVRKRLARTGLDLVPLNDGLQTRFFFRMAEIAQRWGLELYSCAYPIADRVPGILPGRCIDAHWLQTLFGGKVSKAKDSGQRQECLCHKSTDIGGYHMQCPGGCQYCYAFR
jgi:hypothetical protein